MAQQSLFIDQLRLNADVAVLLKAPPIYHAKLDIAGAPAEGAADASVTIVKFEDFQCPYCKQAQPTLEQLLGRYNRRVRLIHKDFPAKRAKILRDGFMKSMADPALLADAARNKLEITVVTGEESTKIAKEVIDQPPEVVDRIKKILSK